MKNIALTLGLILSVGTSAGAFAAGFDFLQTDRAPLQVDSQPPPPPANPPAPFTPKIDDVRFLGNTGEENAGDAGQATHRLQGRANRACRYFGYSDASQVLTEACTGCQLGALEKASQGSWVYVVHDYSDELGTGGATAISSLYCNP